MLGLEDSSPAAARSVKRTPTIESLVVLGNVGEPRTRQPWEKLLYMCQARTDIMYSVKKETSRKILCTTESDKMNTKRITRYLKGVKCQIEINTFP